MMYEVKIMGLLSFFLYRWKREGRKIFKLTDSGYPSFLALGYCNHPNKEIVICRVLNWKLRLLHEMGHEFGLQHIKEKGHVMHPWGFLRGPIIDPSECDPDTYLKMKERYQEALNEQGL
ncbi:hypothetical protein RE474_13720 [Methanolobus sediminis]|uniref:Uncharacterized protein n=1 Tax=Methanolobus sediminis TaxID=3072978 RepID=A0AA51YJ14_9EURY|nr:hypothetical protein [Methanolobus sediminis]WMW25121.1 hypothetical protein RE474_13720 [Methanolobus sediminis]